MIDAVIFDMDGLLIDSEPQWQEARDAVLSRLAFDPSRVDGDLFLGLRPDMFVEELLNEFPEIDCAAGEIVTDLNETAERFVVERSHAMPGAVEFVRDVAMSGCAIGVCSSSPQSLIEGAIAKLGLSETISVLQTTWDEDFSKPHPAAYLTTARKLGVAPKRALVFEDSLPGAIAGKAARMKVCAVPAKGHPRPSEFDFCDATLDGLEGQSLHSVLSLLTP